MSGTTSKWLIPYPQASDTVASLAATVQNLANRVDLLNGESGVWTNAFTAGTPATTAITLSRTYPGNSTLTGGVGPGVVILQPFTSVGSGLTISYWVVSFTGTTSTVTGFTLGGQSSNATTRSVIWRFLPNL